jgi:hypothetical protein
MLLEDKDVLARDRSERTQKTVEPLPSVRYGILSVGNQFTVHVYW